jgi:molecular chaperone Hsp33
MNTAYAFIFLFFTVIFLFDIICEEKIMSYTGKITTALTDDGSARVIFANTTGVVARAAEIHRPSKTVTAALGRCLTAAAVMGSTLKDEQGSLTLRISGGGPAGSFVCVSDSRGNVRGCCDEPTAELPPNALGKLDVGGVVGKSGELYVVRDYGFGEPYVGHCALVSGEIAEDVTNYYAVSEQTPTVCALGVRVDKAGGVMGAGGYMLQLLPGADEDIIPVLQANVDSLPSLSALIAAGRADGDIIASLLSGLPYSLLDEHDIEYRCGCSREKYRSAIKKLGIRELKDMRDSGEEAEIICRFCGTRHVFSPRELADMYDERVTELRQARENR